MAGVNKVILLGNLGRDPEMRYTQGGSPVCRLNLATTRSYTNRQTNERVEETEWHRVVVWGRQAEHCNNYLAKGRTVYVEGRLRTTSYDDKDGNKRWSTEVVADTVQFIGGRGEGGGGGGGSGGGGGGSARGSSGGHGGGAYGGPDHDAPEPFDPGNGHGSGGYIPPGPEDDDIPF